MDCKKTENNPATKEFDSYSGQIEVLTSKYLVNKWQNNTSNSANQCQEERVLTVSVCKCYTIDLFYRGHL